MNDYKAIIKQKRTELGISQAELARRLGISQAYMNQIEQGTRNPTLPKLVKICELLEISMFGDTTKDE